MIQYPQELSQAGPPVKVVQNIHILLVEDSISDAVYTGIIIEETRIKYTLERLKKGNEVIPYLNKCMSHEDILPDLIILDLGLPGQDGFEILNEIEVMSAVIRSIPIVILTEYENFNYLKKTHNLCIFDYITKPCNAEKLRKVLADIASARTYK